MIHRVMCFLDKYPKHHGIFLLALWELAQMGWVRRSTVVDAVMPSVYSTRLTAVMRQMEAEGLIESRIALKSNNGNTLDVRLTEDGKAIVMEAFRAAKSENKR